MAVNHLNREREIASTAIVVDPASIPLWVRLFVVFGGLLMVAGGIIGLVNPAMLASPGDQINGAVHIYAGYFVVRSLALGLFLLVLLALRARRALATLMVLIGFIQLADVLMDCIEGRWAIVPGVLVLGMIYLIGAAQVSGRAFWRRESWV